MSKNPEILRDIMRQGIGSEWTEGSSEANLKNPDVSGGQRSNSYIEGRFDIFQVAEELGAAGNPVYGGRDRSYSHLDNRVSNSDKDREIAYLRKRVEEQERKLKLKEDLFQGIAKQNKHLVERMSKLRDQDSVIEAMSCKIIDLSKKIQFVEQRNAHFQQMLQSYGGEVDRLFLALFQHLPVEIISDLKGYYDSSQRNSPTPYVSVDDRAYKLNEARYIDSYNRYVVSDHMTVRPVREESWQGQRGQHNHTNPRYNAQPPVSEVTVSHSVGSVGHTAGSHRAVHLSEMDALPVHRGV